MLSHERSPPLRSVDLGPLDMEIDRRPDGTICARSTLLLPALAPNATERLEHWAGRTPQQVFLAERQGPRGWRTLTYGEAMEGARSLGQALLDHGLSPQRPLAILSGNSIAHALMALAALHVGIPYVPVSPAYSLISRDFDKLRRIVDQVAPGLVFAEDAAAFDAAVEASVPENIGMVACTGAAHRKTCDFARLLATAPTSAVDTAHRNIRPETIAKILFTSGSLGPPKGVITTHRMLCANQAMIAHALPFLGREPPVLVDWLPWHHSFGGNHNFGLALHHGGTLYIDHGRPTETGLGETLATLREISPTFFVNVPKGFEALLPHLAAEPPLAKTFFRRLRLNFFAGATLSSQAMAALDEIAVKSCGERIGLISGFGATETAPSVLFQTDLAAPPSERAPLVGLPLPGLTLKLTPVGKKYEARVQGPNVTPGYWRDEALTEAAFDQEGFFRLGDALRIAEAPRGGFLFEGRLGEDFKLSSGTTVSVGPLRDRIVAIGAPYIGNVAIAGPNRAALVGLVFPDLRACGALATDLAPGAGPSEILGHPAVHQKFREIFDRLHAAAGGASERITRLALLAEPPSLDAGEITDKGTLNQRAVLGRRAEVVEMLYRCDEGAIGAGTSIAGRPAEPARPPFTFHRKTRRGSALALLKRGEN